MSKILKLTGENELEIAREVADILLDGGTAIFPTDTVYGIGCDGTNAKAVDQIYDIKNRPGTKPLPIIVADMEMAFKYARISEKQEIFIKKHIPGPYTFILKRNEQIPSSPNEKIALRIPEFPFVRMISEYMERPLAATSANISGHPAPHVLSEMDNRIIEKVDAVVNAGETKYKEPSTIIDLTTGKVLRRGAGMSKTNQ